MSTRLCAATPDNWQSFAQLRDRCLREEGHAMGQSHSDIAGWGEADWKTFLSKADRRFFTLVVDDIHVGTTGYKMVMGEDAHAHLIASYIAPEYRGRGHGKDLYTYILAHLAADTQFRRVVVDPRAGNAASIRSIESSGFVATGDSKERVMGDGSHGTLLIYARTL